MVWPKSWENTPSYQYGSRGESEICTLLTSTMAMNLSSKIQDVISTLKVLMMQKAVFGKLSTLTIYSFRRYEKY